MITRWIRKSGDLIRVGCEFEKYCDRLKRQEYKTTKGTNVGTTNQKNTIMVRKYITPIIGTFDGVKKVIGTQVDYLVFGCLVYRKVLNTPAAYGLKEWEFFHRI